MTPFVDVVLPCLDEAAALPWVLSRIPAGYRAIVADNGSADGSPRIAAKHCARVVHVPLRGFGAAAHAGLAGGDGADVCFLDADGSFDPRQLPLVVDPVREDRCRPGARSPPADHQAGLAVHPGRATPWWRRGSGGRPACRSTTWVPLRAARRSALLDLDLTDRRFGYPLEMIVKAARAAGGSRGGRRLRAARGGRAVEGHRYVCGTVSTVLDMGRVLADENAVARHREGAGTRPGEDPAMPAVYSGAGGRHRGRGVGRYPRGGLRDAGRPAHHRPESDSTIRPWPAPDAQRGDGLADRRANGFADTAVPGVASALIGMDTPQVTRGCSRAVATGLEDADAVLGRRGRRLVDAGVARSAAHAEAFGRYRCPLWTPARRRRPRCGPEGCGSG